MTTKHLDAIRIACIIGMAILTIVSIAVYNWLAFGGWFFALAYYVLYVIDIWEDTE